MTLTEKMIARQKELDAFDVWTLGKEVERHLDGWKMVPRDPEDQNWRQQAEFKKGSMSFMLTWAKSGNARDRERLGVESWHWPSYNSFEDRETRKNTFGPQNLYNPKESSPSITVAINRGAEAIAREISRRFLPEYERIYTRCVEGAELQQKYANEARDGWKTICRAISTYKDKCDPSRNSHYISAGGDMNVTVERRGSKAHLKIDADAAQVAAILKALKSL